MACNQVNNDIYYTSESKSNQSLGGDDYKKEALP